MNPQHPIPNAIAGELTPTEMGKEQAPNLNVREKDTTQRTIDENHSHDSTMEKHNVTQYENGGVNTDFLREPKEEHNHPLTKRCVREKKGKPPHNGL